jgi:hypothetical protein
MFDPVGWARYWPIVQKVIGAEIASSPQTRPTPVFGACYEPGTECIPLDVSTNAENMGVRFNRNGLIPSLVHWTRP